MTQPGLFDVHNRLESLSKAGDPLVLLNEKIDWTKFNGTLLLATSILEWYSPQQLLWMQFEYAFKNKALY